MNIAKNMEALFLAALGLALFTSVASAAVPARHAAPHQAAQVIAQADMHVVTITAKRLSAAEKAALAD